MHDHLRSAVYCYLFPWRKLYDNYVFLLTLTLLAAIVCDFATRADHVYTVCLYLGSDFINYFPYKLKMVLSKIKKLIWEI